LDRQLSARSSAHVGGSIAEYFSFKDWYVFDELLGVIRSRSVMIKNKALIKYYKPTHNNRWYFEAKKPTLRESV